MIKFRLANGIYKNVKPEHLDIFKERYPNAIKVDESGNTNNSAIESPAAELNTTRSELVNGFLELPQTDKLTHANAERQQEKF